MLAQAGCDEESAAVIREEIDALKLELQEKDALLKLQRSRLELWDTECQAVQLACALPLGTVSDAPR